MFQGGVMTFNFGEITEKTFEVIEEKYNNRNHCESRYNYIENIKQMFINQFDQDPGNIYFVSSNGIGTFNIAFKDIESDMLVYNLGERGYMVSVGSACDNGNFEDSHVLTSINYSSDYMSGNVRITFNEHNTLSEIQDFIKVLKEEVIKLRGY